MPNLQHKILNAETGELTLFDNLKISQGIKPSDILNNCKTDDVEAWVAKDGDRQNHTIKNLFIDGKYFVFRFYFLNETLEFVTFFISMNKFENGSWDDWSEEEELKEQLFFDSWLTEQIGAQRKFSWGTIHSYYDSKGGFFGIVLRYT